VEGENKMTKTELNKYKKILETKQEELERIVRNRDAITIEKSADALDEVQHAANASWQFVILIGSPTCLGTSGQPFAALKTVLSAPVCIAKKKSVRSELRRCRGRHTAFNARNKPIATLRTVMRCWTTCS